MEHDIITRADAKKRGLIRYFTGVPCIHGHLSEKLTSSATCIECIRVDSAKRRKENWTHVHMTYKKYAKSHRSLMNGIAARSYNRKPKEKRTGEQFECRQRNYESYLLSRAKSRAKSKNIDFDLTVEDIIIPNQCPVLGIYLQFNTGHNRNNTPSLDRIDNAQGYIKGNVRVISMRANRLKSDATIEEIKAILSYMEQHTENNT